MMPASRLSLKIRSSLTITPLTRENGTSTTTQDTAEAIKFGVMVVPTKVTGRMTRPTATEDLSMLMAMSSLETGRTTRPTVQESTSIPMELTTTENGKMTNSMVMVRKLGLMVPNMKDRISKVKNTAKVPSSGLTVHPTSESST